MEGVGFLKQCADPQPINRRTWLKANPTLNYMPGLEQTIPRGAAKANVDPATHTSPPMDDGAPMRVEFYSGHQSTPPRSTSMASQ